LLACGLGITCAGVLHAAAPVAQDDSYQTPQDEALDVAAPGVLTNDDDADGDPVTAGVVSPPANGNLTLQPDGAFTYVPQAGFYGTDSFSYEADDGTEASNVAVVSLTVTQYGAGGDDSGYSRSGSYGAMSPWLLALLALAALYPRGLKPPKRRAISP
jgi:hypothetical protein